MRLVEELKDQFEVLFPDFAERVNNLPETAFILEVAKAFGVAPQVNPSDFSIYIMGLVKNGQAPGEGRGQGEGGPQAPQPE